jgi:hypothetical protein
MLTPHSLPADAVVEGYARAGWLCSVAESPRPSRALVERERTVGEAMRIVEGNAGSQAVAGQDVQFGRHRTQNQARLHWVPVMT